MRALKGSGLRSRLPVVVVVAACVTAVASAITGAVAPLPGLRFLPSGHWVYNSVLQAAFHVDGGTTNIDARVDVPGDQGSQIVQGDTSGYVVGRSRSTEFGKSSLNVEPPARPPVDEVPVGIEVAGGPYLVYRKNGIVWRLGEPAATMTVGGPLGDPVATGDGTLWLFHTTSGQRCELPKGADRISACPAKAPEGHTGGLTLIADHPEFVDTSSATLHQVGENGLGPGRPLGVPTSPTSKPATSDVAGKVAILDPDGHRVHLVDAQDPAKAPVTVALPDGDYDGPACTPSSVVVVNRKTGTVLTYDADGRPHDTKPLPKENGDPRLSRGEDSRVYVESAEGTHVAVVDKDGKVADVPVDGKPTTPAKPADPTPTETPPPPDSAGPPPEHQPEHPAGPPSGQQPPKPAGPAKPPPAVPATAPGAPASVTATAGAGSATVSWGAAPDNRSPVTGYLVSWVDGAGNSGSLTSAGTARRASIPNLTNGARYTVSVAAINAIGTGPAVAANPVTPVAAVAPPGAPRNLTIDAVTAHVDATVTWAAAAPNGAPVTVYHVSWVRDDGSRPGSATVSGTTFSQVITDIWAGAPDVAFTVKVIAENSAGQGPPAIQHKAPPPKHETITISRGAQTSSGSCAAPACAWINTSLAGFDPNTRYSVVAIGNGNDFSEPCVATTDANGAATCDTTRYDVAGAPVYVYVDAPDGRVTSNTITWGSGGSAGQPVVTLTQGPVTHGPNCPEPCHLMHVTMTGFQPNTAYDVDPHSSNPGYSNPGRGSPTDSSGSTTFDAFYYGSKNSTVWVVVSLGGRTVATSAKLVWE